MTPNGEESPEEFSKSSEGAINYLKDNNSISLALIK